MKKEKRKEKKRERSAKSVKRSEKKRKRRRRREDGREKRREIKIVDETGIAAGADREAKADDLEVEKKDEVAVGKGNYIGCSIQ